MDIAPGLAAFLTEQPDLRLAPCGQDLLRVEGLYFLDAEHSAAGRITRQYELAIQIPASFPHQPPAVFEVGGVIPNDPDFHVNSHNGSLCLGSPLALKRLLRSHPD